LEWEEVTVSDPYDEEESSFSKKRGFQLALNVTGIWIFVLSLKLVNSTKTEKLFA